MKVVNLFKPFKDMFGKRPSENSEGQKNGSVHTYTINKRLDAELKLVHEPSLKEAKEKAEEYGRQNLPSVNQDYLTPFEQKKQSEYNGLIQKVTEMTAEPIAKVVSEIENTESAIQRANANEADLKKTVTDEAKKSADRDSKQADASFDEESQHLKSKVKDKQDQIKVLEQQKDKILKEERSSKSIAIFCLLVLIVLTGEAYMNYLVFEYMLREGRLATSLITAAFSVVVAFGCHFFGANLSLFTQKGSWGKKLALVATSVVYATVFYIFGEFRKEYILSLDPEATTPEAWQFMLMNLLLCGVMVYASFKYMAQDVKGVHERKRYDLTINEHKAELTKLKNQLHSLQSKHTNFHAQTSATLLNSIGSVHQGSESLHSRLDQLKTEHGELLAFAQTSELNIQDAFREVIYSFRDHNLTFRASKETPAYWKAPVELELRYRLNSVTHSSQPIYQKVLNHASCLLIALSLFSCGNPKVETTKALVAIDITDAFTMEELPSGTELMKAVEFDIDAQNPQRLDFGFTVLSDVSANKVEHVSIDLSDGDENKFNRTAKGKKFSLALDSVLKGFGQVEKGKQRSCIYRPLCSLLTELQESDADNKTIIVFSDLLENSDIINLYSSEFIWDGEFNTTLVKAKFEGKIPFPRCEGIDVIVVCQPTPETDQLILKVQQLYQAFFEKHGAESITFVTNL